MHFIAGAQHICSWIIFLVIYKCQLHLKTVKHISVLLLFPTCTRIDLCRHNSVGFEQRKGIDYSLQLIVHRWSVLFPHLSLPDLRGISCHSSAAEPFATSVNKFQVLLAGSWECRHVLLMQMSISGALEWCKTLLRFPKPRQISKWSKSF